MSTFTFLTLINIMLNMWVISIVIWQIFPSFNVSCSVQPYLHFFCSKRGGCKRSPVLSWIINEPSFWLHQVQPLPVWQLCFNVWYAGVLWASSLHTSSCEIDVESIACVEGYPCIRIQLPCLNNQSWLLVWLRWGFDPRLVVPSTGRWWYPIHVSVLLLAYLDSYHLPLVILSALLLRIFSNWSPDLY